MSEIVVEVIPPAAEVAAVVRAAGPAIGRRVGVAMAAAARPVGRQIAETAGEAFPHRGGLAAIIRGADVDVQAGIVGGNAIVNMELRTEGSYDLAGMNRGRLIHPVFARDDEPRTWVQQRVHAGAFTAAWRINSKAIEREVQEAAEVALHEVAVATHGI